MQLNLSPSLRSLELQSQVISIESLSRHMPNKPLLAKLSTLAAGVADFVSQKTTGLFQRSATLQFNLSGSPSSAIKGTQYLDFKDVMLPCPEGLRVSYLEYAEIIQDAQKITSYLLEDCLYPFSAFISEALNHPEKMASAIRTSGAKVRDLEPLRKKLNNAFDGVNGELPYVKALARNADWDDLEKALSKIIATQKQTNDKLIAEKIDEIQRNLATLIDRMQDTNQKYRPSAELINEMSRITYALAEQVTFYSIISTSIEALVVSVEAAKKVVKAAAKN